MTAKTRTVSEMMARRESAWRRTLLQRLGIVSTLAAILFCAATSPAAAECPPIDRPGAGNESDDGIGGSGRAKGALATLERTPAIAYDADSGGDEDGIGGSGRSAGDEDGIGGSGLYGTITGFGSICVNGRRITYGEDTPVELDDLAGSVDDLALGQVVAVRAVDDVAQRIEVNHAVVGEVESVSRDRVRVSGIEVRVEPAVAEALEIGERVAISGLWHPDGSVVASRVGPTRPAWKDRVFAPEQIAQFAQGLADFDVEGYVARSAKDGIEVSGVRFAAAPEAELPAVGERVRVRARRTDAGLLRIRDLDRVRTPRLELAPRGPEGTELLTEPEHSERRDARRERRDALDRDRLERRERAPIERPERFDRPEGPQRPNPDRPRPGELRDRPRRPRLPGA